MQAKRNNPRSGAAAGALTRLKAIVIATGFLVAGLGSSHAIDPQDIETAAAAYAAEDWARARDAYARLVDEAPWHGPFLRRLADTNAKLGELTVAQDLYVRLRANGHEAAAAAFEIAAIEVARDDFDGAAQWLTTALREGLNNVAFRLLIDPRFASAFEDETFAALFRPVLPDGAPRADKWRTDLDHLDRHYRLTHIDPFGRVSEARWSAEMRTLKAAAETASDAEMAVGLMRLMALAGDGHTRPFAPYGDELFGVARTPAFFTIAPLDLYDFGGEIRVIAAGGVHADLVGARLERIGDLPADAAYARVKEIVPADNVYQKRWMAMRSLTTPQILHALGISREPLRFRIVARHDDGRRLRKTVNGVPHEEGRFTRAVSSLARKQIANTPEDRPLYLRHAEDPFALAWSESGAILYIQINTLLNDREHSVEAFSRQIAAAIREERPRAVAIDLRWNSGGDSGFNRFIVNAIAGSPADAPGRLFTIIGRRTFSAAINLTSALKAYTHTTLVGEPSGSAPNFIGETNAIFLPNTGMIVSASNRRHQGLLSEKQDRWWTPDLPAEPTWQAYKDGIDPAMQMIERAIVLSQAEDNGR